MWNPKNFQVSTKKMATNTVSRSANQAVPAISGLKRLKNSLSKPPRGF
jgi:hypothetical protein